jgi:hypothetical protein
MIPLRQEGRKGAAEALALERGRRRTLPQEL